jgi:regulator of protease activity HflC (stomatin/prohibitin superfamily)
MMDKPYTYGIPAVLALLILSAGAVASIETVDEGHEKVVKNKGEATTVFTPGDWYFINPITQSTESINTRPQAMLFTDDQTAGEKTGQDNSIKVITQDDVKVPVNLQTTYKVTDSKTFYETWKTHSNFRARALYPGVEDGVLEVGGGLNSSVIATDQGRSAMREAAKAELDERVEGTGATVISVSIKKVRLPDRITSAAAKAQAKEQELVAKEKEIEIERKEAERKRIEAQADRDARLIRAEAYQNEGVLEAMYIEKLDETDTVYVPVGSEDGLPRHLEIKANGTTASDRANTTASSRP